LASPDFAEIVSRIPHPASRIPNPAPLHLLLHISDQLLGDGDAAVDDVGGVPVVLVEDDLTLGVEAHTGHADGLLPGATRRALKVEAHGPVEVEFAVGPGDVVKDELGVLQRLEAGQHVFDDRPAALELLEGVAEIHLFGVDQRKVLRQILAVVVAEKGLYPSDHFGFGLGAGLR